MVEICFQLNEDNIKRQGESVSKVEAYLRDFYNKRNAIEVKPLTFQRDDENAMSDLGDIIPILRSNPNFFVFFEKCIWNVDGEEEDCLYEISQYISKYGLG